MGQVVEHLPAPALVRTFELAAAKLRRGGLLIAETINPLSPLALRNYFADLTHAQPLVPETLELLARQAGFAPPRSGSSMSRPSASASRTTRSSPQTCAELNELLFAPLDYALVARTGSDE